MNQPRPNKLPQAAPKAASTPVEPTQPEQTSDYPVTEVILPSRGLLSNGTIPDGIVAIRPFTTAEETILAGGRGMSGNRLISTLLTRCIVSPKIDPADLLITDRFFLMLILRSISYGSQYGFKIACEKCSVEFKHDADLSKDFVVRTLENDATEPMPLTLPLSNAVLEVRFLRGTDEEAIERYANQKLQKSVTEGDPTYIYQIARQIVSWNGEKDALRILAKVEKMIAGDSLELRSFLEDVSSGVETIVHAACPRCGNDNEVGMPLTPEFFRPRRSRSSGH